MYDTRQQKVTLKTMADYPGLAPATISVVLNHAPAAERIPQATQDRIRAAARRLDYRPNPLARALRSGRSQPPPAPAAGSNTRRALHILDAEHFLMAMNAIQKAGLRVPGDVAVVEVEGSRSEGDRERV